MTLRYLLFLLLTLPLQLIPFEQDPEILERNLMVDLMIVDQVNRQINDRLPVTFNHFLQGGYLVMPSARVGAAGEIGFGYASVPPYRTYNARLQLLSRLEITGNYRIFCGIEDPILSPHGFGDFSDKGASFKVAFLHPEDSDYELPGFAFGMDDIMGTRAFKSTYLVFTKVFLKQDFEVSLGYGIHRFRGFFGGLSWMPFRQSCMPLLEGISLVAEYDATDYKNHLVERHPEGRHPKHPINLGVKYRLWDYFDFCASWVKGNEFAASVSAFYNFGETEGFLPKIDDSLPYRSPINVEPIGALRPEQVLAQDFVYALRDQDFELLDAKLSFNECGLKVLRLSIYNWKYRLECEVRSRLSRLLAYLTPMNLNEVIVVIEAEGFPVQEYRYNREFLMMFEQHDMCEPALNLLTPMHEVSFVDPAYSQTIFKDHRDYYNPVLLPKTHNLFGSSSGKFKYAVGVNAGLNGFIFDNFYYSFLLGYIPFTDLNDVSDVDILNPSQLINVRTDVINYYKQKCITIDQAYLQKNWNMGCGWYSRITGGYFEQEYGGAAGQLLFYPVNSCWAVGLEAAVFKKRKTKGLGFTDKIRKLDGFRPTYRKFTGSHMFLDLFYEWDYANIDFEVSVGKFMANDWGSRFVVSKYYPSGLRISLWYTLTNAHDVINGKVYHDKGFEFSMPIDIFYTHSSRNKWGYGMSAWLRDCGFRCTTGEDLYYMINDLRQ